MGTEAWQSSHWAAFYAGGSAYVGDVCDCYRLGCCYRPVLVENRFWRRDQYHASAV